MARSDDSPSRDRGAPAGRRERFFKLAGMTASVASKYATSRLSGMFKSDDDAQDARIEAFKKSGERIAETLGELKGAAMKIGQMASIGSDVLPKELSDALSKLQKEAPPMAYEVIAEQIERELGAAPELLFDHFDTEPFAAASIGQVHRARVDDGREVVVKVQYPGVDASVDSDLAHLRLALRASGLVQKAHRPGLSRTFKRVRERLHEELDYTLEADNVRLFGAHHAQHPGIVVPEVVGERSSKRILTLTYEPGCSFSELDREGFTQEERDRVGENLVAAVTSQIFELQAVQADPNPANFACRRDGTVVLYDFGCVERIADDLLTPYVALIGASWSEDYALAERYLTELGARNLDGPPVEHAFYKRWRDIFLEPFFHDAPFDFGAAELHRKVMEVMPDSIRRMNSFQPADRLVFVDRAITGGYGNLRAIRARVNVVSPLHGVIELPTREPSRS